uniref:Death domain-containing protein n=1 Tax=Amphimedon queenslandica TaxID=400682 RepID=A0A1X7UTC4_AMPQE
VYNLNSSCMRLVMREKDYWSDISVSDISDVGGTLKEIFNMRRHNSSHTQLLYVSSDPEDYQKGFRDSLMYKCIEFDFNWIPLNITIPPGPKASIPTTTNKRNGKIIMKIITIEEENRGEKRKVQVQVDKRITLAQLKEELVPLIRVPPTGFIVYGINGYKLKNLDEILMNVSESKLIVKLRPLQEGEHRIKLYLLQVNSIEFCEFMMESIVTSSTPVREFKKQIIEEAKVQGIDCVLELDKMRLRFKNRMTPGRVYLDHHWTNTIHAIREMYVEPLKGLEEKKHYEQRQVYVIRWRPSQCSVDPIEEIILDDIYDTKHFIKKLSELSGVPAKYISFSQGKSFPVEISCLDIENELTWHSDRYLVSGLYVDGYVIYYKDNREKMKKLRDKERSEIQEAEEARLKRIRDHITTLFFSDSFCCKSTQLIISWRAPSNLQKKGLPGLVKTKKRVLFNIGDLINVLDLLEKCCFPEKKWYKLGLRLGLKKNTLDTIEKNHPHDVSRCMTECLSQWLGRADNVDSRGGANLNSLSDALGSMNETAVAEKLKHHVLINIFNNRRTVLSQSLCDSVAIARLLYAECMLTQEAVSRVVSASPSIPNQREALLTAVKEAVQTDPNSLHTFANVLCTISTNVSLGQTILDDIKTEYKLRDAISSKEKERIELKQEISMAQVTEEELLSVQSDTESVKEVEEEPLYEELTVLSSQFNEIKEKNKELTDKLSKMKIEFLRSLSSKSDSAVSKVRRGMSFEIDDCKFQLEAMTRPDYQPWVDNKRMIEKLQERITLMIMELMTEREHNEKIIKDIKVLKKTEEKTKRQRKKGKQIEEEMCLIILYCNHPVTGELNSSFLEVHKDELLPIVLDIAYETMELAPHIPIERCRLVKYDYERQEMEDLDEFQHLTIGQIMDVVRCYSLFLETRTENETFKKYNTETINLRVSVVDFSSNVVGPPQEMRAWLGWTVEKLKQHIGE